jgi:hypothetical protein
MTLAPDEYGSQEEALTAARAVNALLYKVPGVGTPNYTVAIVMDTFHPSTTEGYVLKNVRVGGKWPEGVIVWKWFKMTPLQGPDSQQSITETDIALSDDIERG